MYRTGHTDPCMMEERVWMWSQSAASACFIAILACGWTVDSASPPSRVSPLGESTAQRSGTFGQARDSEEFDTAAITTEGEKSDATGGNTATADIRVLALIRKMTQDSLRSIHTHIKHAERPMFRRFLKFVDRHNKAYLEPYTALRRFKIYKENALKAQQYQQMEQGTAVYGETKFSDLTVDEFRQTYLPYVWDRTQKNEMKVAEISDEAVPDTFDWRPKGAVTGVKDQGACGSCWAFSTTGNVEGQWFLAKKKLVSVSEQELVDCDSLDQGCNGGLPSNAYKEIIRLGGLEPEDVYPYTHEDDQCAVVKTKFAVYINDSLVLPQDEDKMKIFLATKGPISIGINANPLQFYRKGISYPWKIFCEPFMLNHGVLIVGYGQEGKKPYWLIKNSWGEKWGEQGYYRLYRGKNVCGVNEMATSSIVL